MSSQERRDAALAQGLCPSCCIRKPIPPNKTCDTCIAAAARGRRLKKIKGPSDGWCMECIAFLFHRVGCPAAHKTFEAAPSRAVAPAESEDGE